MKNYIKNFKEYLINESNDVDFNQTAMNTFGDSYGSWINLIDKKLSKGKCVLIEDDILFMKKIIQDVPGTILPHDITVIDLNDVDEIFKGLSESEIPMFYYTESSFAYSIYGDKLTKLLDVILSYCLKGQPVILFAKESDYVGPITRAIRPIRRKYASCIERFSGTGRTNVRNPEGYASPKRGYSTRKENYY